MTRSTLLVILFGLLVLAYLGYKVKTQRAAPDEAEQVEVGSLERDGEFRIALQHSLIT